MKEFSVIGKSVMKKDAIDKVLGKSVFGADLMFPDMAYVEVLRSPIVAGFLKSIDASKAEAMEGVVRVITGKDIPGINKVGMVFKDEPALIEDKIRRHGEPIALVVAESQYLAKEAMKLIEVEYEEIEPVLTIERALEEDSPKLFGDTNLMTKKTLTFGKDIDEAFKECDVIVENEYETSMNSHMFIEPECGVAKYENGIVTLYTSTQNSHFDRGETARVLGLPQSKVRSVQMTTGGGFGGKLDISVQAHLGLAAYLTGRTVKMIRSRRESTALSSKRHAMKIKAKTGATKDGKLKAMYCHIEADSGAYGSYGPAVIVRSVVHCTGPYEIPNVQCEATFVYTNNPMCGAFRGFGVPQVAVVHEGQIDAIAKELGMDPIEIRKINAHRIGSTTATGQVLNDSVGLLETIEEADKKADEVIGKNKKGRGTGCMWYGIGNTALPNPAAAFVEVLSDASVNLMVGCADIGQGSDTVMAQICAQELGVLYENVTVTSADTGVTPEGGASSASRQTFISGSATREAAKAAKEILKDAAAPFMGVDKENLVFENNTIYDKENPENKIAYPVLMEEMRKLGKVALGAGSYNPKTTPLSLDAMQGSPYETYAYATSIADVEVDTETGRIYVKKVVSAHDVGTAINRQMIEAQIEGGIAMGQGFALFEKIEVSNGKITNPMFSKYIVPTSMDTPEVYPIIVECESSTGPFGAKGIGEPTLIAAIPAIVSAVEDAIGIRFNKLPITPPDVLKALEEKNK